MSILCEKNLVTYTLGIQSGWFCHGKKVARNRRVNGDSGINQDSKWKSPPFWRDLQGNIVIFQGGLLL